MRLRTNAKELVTTRKITRRECVIPSTKLRRIGIDVRECSGVLASRGEHKRRAVPVAPDRHPAPLPCGRRMRRSASAECECARREREASDDSGLQLSVHIYKRPQNCGLRYRKRNTPLWIGCFEAQSWCYRGLFAEFFGCVLIKSVARRSIDSLIR